MAQELIKCFCEWCKRKTLHSVVKEPTVQDEDLFIEVQTLRCTRCDALHTERKATLAK